MSSDRTSCKLLSSGNIRLPRARLYYPWFFKARPNKKEPNNADKARYQTEILLSKGAQMAILVKAVEDLLIDKLGADYAKKHKVSKPFLKTEDQPKLSEFVDEYPVLMRLKSRDRPGIVFSNGMTCDESKSHEVYSGRWAFVSVRPGYYDVDGSKGVTCYLQNVQLLEDDDRLGGGRVSAESEFESADVSSTEEMFS